MITIITTEACGDQATYPRSNKWQRTMLTMNPSLFLKALSTPSNCIPWIKSTTYPWTFRISQIVLQKSSSSIVLSEWQLFDYLLDTCMLICVGIHTNMYSSVGKESTCNAGDPDSILRSGRSAGEGIGYPLQYSWNSLVAQLVKNLPAMWWDLGLIPGLGRSVYIYMHIYICIYIYTQSSFVT